MTGEKPVVQVWRRREPWSGGAALVVVLEAAEVGDLNDRTAGWRLCGPRDRRILVEREVSTPLVVVIEEAAKRASQGPLIPHDDVIETLPPEGPDDALDERILRLTNFKTSNGPDVHVYLVAAPDATDNATVTKAGFVDLGSMKGNVGDQNYDVPDSVDLGKYRAATIWCERFNINFATAPLSPAGQ